MCENGEVSGSKCEERRECGEMESVKKEGGQCEGKGKCDDKGVLKSYIQFLCTAHLYSDEHTVFVIRIYIIDTVYGSHFYLTVKNQRHHMIGINDCENLGMVK